MSARITNRLRAIITSYLRAQPGWSLLGTILAQMDTIAQDMADAVRESLIAVCDEDALDLHGRNSNDRRSSRETAEQFRAYLLTRWDRKQEAGTEDGLRYQLRRIGYPNVDLVCERDLREAGISGAFGGKVGYSFVVLHQPHPFSQGNLWDDDRLWDDGTLWGANAISEAQVGELIFTLQKWKPDGTSFRFAIIDNDGTTTWDASGFHGNYDTIPINEPWEYLTGSPLIPDYNTDFVNP